MQNSHAPLLPWLGATAMLDKRYHHGDVGMTIQDNLDSCMDIQQEPDTKAESKTRRVREDGVDTHRAKLRTQSINGNYLASRHNENDTPSHDVIGENKLTHGRNTVANGYANPLPTLHQPIAIQLNPKKSTETQTSRWDLYKSSPFVSSLVSRVRGKRPTESFYSSFPRVHH